MIDDSPLRKLVSDILDVPQVQITDQASMKSIESWDSLRHIQLMTAIEEEFQLELSIEEMVMMTSYPEIKRIISEKRIK